MPKEPPKFKIIPIDEPPKRSYTKTSIYDPVIDSFLERKIDVGRIDMTKKDGTPLDGEYVTRRLVERLAVRKMSNVKAFTRNHEAYLQLVK